MEEAEAGTEVDGVYLELCTWRKLNKLREDWNWIKWNCSRHGGSWNTLVLTRIELEEHVINIEEAEITLEEAWIEFKEDVVDKEEAKVRLEEAKWPGTKKQH